MMQRVVALVFLVTFTLAGCLNQNTTSNSRSVTESKPPIKSVASQNQPAERSAPANNTLKQAKPTENKPVASGQNSSQARSSAMISVAKPIQPAAKALICAVPTTNALKKDYARKPENCRIVEIKHEAQALDLKCDRFYEISRVFTNGNYSCDVNVVKCAPGAPCDFSEFPCKVGDRQSSDHCSGVKQIPLTASKPAKTDRSR